MGNVNLKWAWIFGNETPTILNTMGWLFSSTITSDFQQTQTAANVRTYPGAAASRWCMEMKDGNTLMHLPGTALAAIGNAGAVAWSTRLTATQPPGGNVIRAIGSDDGDTAYLQWDGFAVMRCYFGEFGQSPNFAGSTSPIDLTTYNWMVFKVDLSTTTHKVTVEANGVVILAEVTNVLGYVSAQTSISDIYLTAAPCVVTEFAVFNIYAATVPIMYIDRYEPTADGTDNGTWTPFSGGGDYADLDSPADDGATYTSGAGTSGEYVEVTSASSINTQLGVTVGTIHAVVACLAAQGSAASMDIRISDDGTTFADDAVDIALDGSTKITQGAAATRPGVGAGATDWAGTDTITFRAQVA